MLYRFIERIGKGSDQINQLHESYFIELIIDLIEQKRSEQQR